MNSNLGYLVLAALLVAGCGGGGYEGSGGNGNSQPPPGATGTAFTPFIKAQLTQTSNTAEPTDVNDKQFEFDEDETSFDDVLQ
ncbi:hypothetical protein [Peristeroidobacter soli]|jgi:hypothetical protein|uniref:hypothetical protein n=1 Tax=Peristeroidobacter soli TaxID=2497877 RepID=UPI00101B8BEA|nr:hypothetical protein [Peristeroidobacter soli]